MPSIIIIEKHGIVKEVSLKKVNESELYKKAGLKTDSGFKCFNQWSIEYGKQSYTISLYGKTTGRANYENKYEFPPPLDNTLFFGTCVLIAKNAQDIVVDLTEDMWEKIYETLYGGFEDIAEDDSDCSSDIDIENPGKMTKNGYVKDGFVVEDDELEDDDELDEDEELDEDDENSDEESGIYSRKSKSRSKSKQSGSDKIKHAFELKPVQEETFLDCTSELSEEDYLE